MTHIHDPQAETIEIDIPTGEEIYASIMGGIEPDLLLENIGTLGEKYAGESEKDRMKRSKRYKKALKKYEKEAAAWMKEFKTLLKQCDRESLMQEEAAERK